MRFSVLFVCTGNICRSPLAERLLRSRLDAATPITVLSAGTAALVGRGIDEPSALALRELGVDSAAHVARRLSVEHIASADLILTAESAHRSAIVQADPLSFRKTYTVREFGRLGAGLPRLPVPPTVEVLRARVVEVAGQRGWVEAPFPGADETADPFGASAAVARRTAAELSAAIDAVVAALGLPPDLRPSDS